jgi:hypothetical protein
VVEKKKKEKCVHRTLMPLLPVNINRPFFFGKSRDITQGQKKMVK